MRLRVLLMLISLAPAATLARGGEVADALLRLAPADAGMTILVEDLRGHARRFYESALPERLGKLPAVRDWRASARGQGLRQAKRHIEQLVGEPIATLRDDLLGDAVVLALHLDPNDAPDQARGVLLTHVRNQALLDRVVAEFNAAQIRKGEIVRVSAKEWRGAPYSARVFRDARRPTEFYATFDHTFAWSNSEALLRGTLERQIEKRAGLGDDPRFRRIREKLSGGAAASVFLDGKFLRRVLASAPQSRKSATEERVGALVNRYIAALEYAGASLEWRDGLRLQTEETLDPERLDPWIKAWAARSGKIAAGQLAVPPSALAMASLYVDFPALLSAVEAVVPEPARGKTANVLEVLRGILLGRDVRTEILPYLGPGTVAYVESPQPGDSNQGVPFVMSADIGRNTQVGAALENALRTLLALYALEEQRTRLGLSVQMREIDGTKVVSLRPSSPFAFAVSQGRIVIGRSPEAVARAFRPEHHPRLAAFRARHFPDANSFACADLVAVKATAEAQRPALVQWLAARNHRPEETEARDLEQVLALIGMFKAAYVTSTMAADATAVHRSIGLVDLIPQAND